jgi:hypothetical protein
MSVCLSIRNTFFTKRLSGPQTFARMIDARTQHDILPGASTLTISSWTNSSSCLSSIMNSKTQLVCLSMRKEKVLIWCFDFYPNTNAVMQMVNLTLNGPRSFAIDNSR